MSMGVSIVITYTVDPEKAEELTKRVREHLVPAARQVQGYRGFLVIDQGDGKRLTVLLFEAAAGAQAALQALSPLGREHIYELIAGPAQGSLGTVVVADGAFAEPASP